MRSKRFLFALFCIFLYTLTCVAASDDFFVTANQTYSDIFQDEEAIFNFTIYNELQTNERFIVKFGSQVDWVIDTVPASDYFPKVYRKSVRDVTISIRAKDYVPIGRHRVQVTIQNQNTREIKTLDFDILVKPIEWKALIPNVQVNIGMDNDIDPRVATIISVGVRNLNRLNLTGLNLKLSSKVINDERTITLKGIAKKTEGFLVKLNPLQEPLKDELMVVASINYEGINYTFDISQKFDIIGYSDLIEKSEIQKSILSTKEVISVKNDGNQWKEFEIVRKRPWLRGMFMTATPNAGYLKTFDGTFFYWKIGLDPQESTTLQIRESYRPIVGLLALALIILILYYLMRSPVVIRKAVSQIGTSEGGISELKIVLHLKSRTKHAIDTVAVIDKIPHITEMGDDFSAGTIRPTKMYNTKNKGLLVRWEIPNLEPYEERIITYKLKSKLSILGGIVLPPCLVKFIKPNGKEVRTRSNKVTLEI